MFESREHGHPTMEKNIGRQKIYETQATKSKTIKSQFLNSVKIFAPQMGDKWRKLGFMTYAYMAV